MIIRPWELFQKSELTIELLCASLIVCIRSVVFKRISPSTRVLFVRLVQLPFCFQLCYFFVDLTIHFCDYCKTFLELTSVFGIERFRFIKVKLKTIFFNEMYIDFGLHMIPVYSGFSLNRFHCMIFFRLISLQLWIAFIILCQSLVVQCVIQLVIDYLFFVTVTVIDRK